MIRRYKDSDYDQLRELYFHSEWYGNYFDAEKDSQEKLASCSASDPDSILVYMDGKEMLGSISFIENCRVAWLFRFGVKNNSTLVAEKLYSRAVEILRKRGHTQVLVLCPLDDKELRDRYDGLGMILGEKYSTYLGEI